MNNLAVAQTIAKQIGQKAFMMIGAKNMLGSENSLTFKIGRNAKGVTHVKIELNSMDTYDMSFLKCRAAKVTILNESAGVYSDMLNGIIEKETGMYTKLS